MKNIGFDGEDWLGLQTAVNKSFDINLEDYNQKINTYQDLVSAVNSLVPHADSTDCTTQQAFYKLRSALNYTVKPTYKIIHPTTPLNWLFEPRSKKQQIKQLEKELGVDLFLEGMGRVSSFIVVCLLLLSIGLLFFHFVYGLLLFGISIGFAWLLDYLRIDHQFRMNTVGDLSTYIAATHYTKIRRNKETMNRSETTTLLKKMLELDFGIAIESITPETAL